MNLLSLVGPRLDNICQIRRKWYYSSGSKNLQSEQGLDSEVDVMSAATALCDCQSPIFVLKTKVISGLPYVSVVRMPRICSSVVFWFIKCGRISFTPSCSTGSMEVQNGGFAENQTALAKVQWMNKWESFSAMLQVEHSLLILFEYFPALCLVARVLINLQHKVLMHGASCLCFHVLVKMYMACGVMLLDPFWGSWTRKLLLRSLKASL